MLDNDIVKYRVVVNGVVMNESTNKLLAEAFIDGLPLNVKKDAVLESITSDGKQVLMG